ncbi:oligopeptide/dipeptide ABC transporter ATP-binding protein [Cytobacillus praedii]|uniref:oligopeptide/dipeptide ABC transporter ATP-binding protein n=1 Tax=Cytobacillus praedii TaxID=1742358 RepID=UPI002E1A7AC8|nr:oligopeptide/dipeptide ABC transporter ATP-binding protein [Cytobacillus praedii]MED3550227.1 ATP-binding cassette domain-containing protein [Cytobacillus praedii]
MKTKSPFIKIDKISMWYPQKSKNLFMAIREERKWIKAVDQVSIELERGEILGVIGESGCGKSTLGKVLARLENPTNGDVYIDSVSTKELMKKDTKKFRRMVQIVFQNPFDTFTPRDTIEQILLRPLKIHGIGKTNAERREICIKALESGGLRPADEIMKRYPHELSGGQLQRISILRSMLFEPKFIIADEPVSMLDVSVRSEIINMLLTLSKEKNATVIFISHDIALTRYVSDKIAVMYLGKVVEYGDSDTIINNPKHPYTQALISNCSSIDPDEQRDIIKIQGEPPTPVNPGPGCYFASRCFKATKECFQKYPAATEVSEGHIVACDRWY